MAGAGDGGWIVGTILRRDSLCCEILGRTRVESLLDPWVASAAAPAQAVGALRVYETYHRDLASSLADVADAAAEPCRLVQWMPLMTIADLGSLAVWLITDDWLIAACLAVLAAGWLVLRAKEGPPVLALAYTLQWTSITIGLFYVAATNRPLQATLDSDYRPMVIIGLGVLLAMLAGLSAGQWLVERRAPSDDRRAEHALTLKTLIVSYVVAVGVVGAVQQAAWDYPSSRRRSSPRRTYPGSACCTWCCGAWSPSATGRRSSPCSSSKCCWGSPASTRDFASR